MQLKGFVAGAAVVALAWLGSTAWGNFAAEMQAAPTQAPAGVYAADRGMTEAEKEAHVAEMRRLWESMTPAQREAHRNMGVCPYSGRSAQGAGPRGAGPILRERRQPVEI
ncbi:hypothetical protein [Thioalkalivibrio sp. XN8]|uniref:hypothetical protein n=1 Tax=Thioalkalivibrio sp. XN8 TaxID=2712863 RepID=UPI0013EA8EF7|nr:hypothetical protein [Thioalkalivibrio sp. XN8]NGP52487.1 hypothetical protein [Thioalkalivibrio sp. XN8]